MVAIAKTTRHVSGRPVARGEAGGDPGPLTALGFYLGIKAAIREGLGTDRAEGVRVAIQGVGSVGGGVARRLAEEDEADPRGRRSGARQGAGRGTGRRAGRFSGDHAG